MNTTNPVRSTSLAISSSPWSSLSPVSPLERLASLRQDMDRLWELSFTGRGAQTGAAWSPALDLYDEAEQLVTKIELPGLSREAVAVNYQDGVLSISGDRKGDYAEGQEPDCYRSERAKGKFSRDLALPVPVQADKIRAAYKDGVLTVIMPKSEDAKPHRVEVNVS
jgi:HSP20 family protein